MTVFGLWKDCSDHGLQLSEMPPEITLLSCLIGFCVGIPHCNLMHTVPITVGYALAIMFR
jgi:hypothetical protein